MMPAPLLTPLDTPIFDDDVIAEMEQHLDDVPPCIACAQTATIRATMLCCGDAAFYCTRCFVRWLLRFNTVSALAKIYCGNCGQDFGYRPKPSSVFRVVSL